MPVVIGGVRQSGFDDPFGLLSDCHRRIEMFLGVLVKAAELAPEELGTAEGDALRRALDHFRDAAPKHTKDEEESVFPRMRAAAADGSRDALDALAALEADHVAADKAHEEIDRLGRRWIEDGTLPDQDRERFGALARSLSEIYARHIAIEDQDVFPMARKVLNDADVRSIGREMAERRGQRAPGT